MRINLTDKAAMAKREAEIRQLAKEAGFLVQRNGIRYTLIEPGHKDLLADDVIKLCKARRTAKTSSSA